MRARRWGGLRCLSSAVPFLADLLALRRVPARFSGVFVIANTVSVVIAGRRGH